MSAESHLDRIGIMLARLDNLPQRHRSVTPDQLLGRLFRYLLQEFGEGLDPVRWLRGHAVAGINCVQQVLRRIELSQTLP
jgi:hypothetical protein